MTFDALLTAAMAGTARRAPEPDPAEPWVAALPADDAERALLLRAGAHALARFAGQRAAEGPAPVAPAAPETSRPCAPGAAAYVLSLAKEAGTRPVALEALALMRARGLHLPHGLLPDVLATTDRELREALLPVLGMRGAWLGGFRPDWSWAARAAAPAEREALRRAWDEGTPSERVDALLAMRRLDPAEGRAWVASAAGDKPEQRGLFLQALATGLTIDDLPVLERGLADRAPTVRQAAAHLLARLPGTALAARMAARAAAVVTGDLARGLAIRPPEELPADWAADGLDARPPYNTGPRAWWLHQLLALTPLGHWRRLGAPAEVVAALAADEEWGWQAVGAVGLAALEQDAPAWLEAVHDALAARLVAPRRTKTIPNEAYGVYQALIPRLPASRLAELVLHDLDGGRVPGQHYVRALEQLPRPWPPAFAEAFLTRLAARVRTLPEAYNPLSDPWIAAMGPAALSLDPAAEARVPSISDPDRPAVQPLAKSLDRLRQLLALRRRLVEEIVP